MKLFFLLVVFVWLPDVCNGQCAAGTYLSGLSCTQCSAGYSCAGSLWPPAACASGTYSTAGASVCTTCPSGSFCPAPNLLPVSEATSTAINRASIVSLAKLSNLMYNVTQSYASSNFLIASQSDAHTLGVVTLSDDKSTIIAVFRGTNLAAPDDTLANPANLIQDITAVLVAYSPCSNCYIHYGFLTAYNTIVSQMKANVKTLQSSFPSATKLVVTGHSLGGAMATLFAMDLVVNEKASGVSLVTFGSPRVGNAAFSQFTNSRINGTNWRVTYDNDVITVLPLVLMGFKHVGAEVHYAPSGGHYFLMPVGVDVDYTRASLLNHLSYPTMTA